LVEAHALLLADSSAAVQIHKGKFEKEKRRTEV